MTYLLMPNPTVAPYAFAPAGTLIPRDFSMYQFVICRGLLDNFIATVQSTPGGQFWPRGN